MKFVFFGTPEFSEIILEELKKEGLLPSLIITAPDRKSGRGMKLQSPEVKEWALKNNVPYYQPEKLDAEATNKLREENWDLFVVAAYGKIIPKEILEIPKHKSINVHPSLLPLYRGPSPIQYQILNDEKEIGTTIMLMDEKMDHGPIIDQKFIDVEMPLTYGELMPILAKESGKLLTEVMPAWINEEIEPQKQEHDFATFTKMITKEDGEINLHDDPYLNYLKYLAFYPWPGVYFFIEKNGRKTRVKITEASCQDDEFIIQKVIPEGKKEMSYIDFKRNI